MGKDEKSMNEKKEQERKENEKRAAMAQQLVLFEKGQFDVVQFYKEWMKAHDAEFEPQTNRVDIPKMQPDASGKEAIGEKQEGKKALGFSFRNELQAKQFFTALAEKKMKFVVFDGKTGNVLYFSKGDGKLEMSSKKMHLEQWLDSKEGAWAKPTAAKPDEDKLEKKDDIEKKSKSMKDMKEQLPREETPSTGNSPTTGNFNG